MAPTPYASSVVVHETDSLANLFRKVSSSDFPFQSRDLPVSSGYGYLSVRRYRSQGAPIRRCTRIEVDRSSPDSIIR